MTTSPVCLKCGSIGKSGKTSCCGRGGSWFENCGGAANVKLEHTWYEGIRVCKTRSQFNTVIAQHLNDTQEKDIDSSSNGDGIIHLKSIPTSTKEFTFTLASTTTYDPVHTSPSTPMMTQGCGKLFNFALFTSVLYLSL